MLQQNRKITETSSTTYLDMAMMRDEDFREEGDVWWDGRKAKEAERLPAI
jgi:hypothetical protein